MPKNTFNYVAGGPIFSDPVTGTRMMIYHAEKHFGSMKNYYTVLGMAICLDPKGLSFTDLGTIVEPNIQVGQMTHSIDIGGGSFAVVGDYLNVYYRDYLSDGTSAELAVARAPVSQLFSNAFSGLGTTFNKYYNGSWDELGRGGKASPLEIGNPTNAWSAVSYNDYLDQVVMVSSQWDSPQPNLYIAASPDGVNFSPRQPLVLDGGEQFYPTIIGTGADPSRSDQSFYVYYTDSQKGAWNRAKDANLVRRSVTIDAFVPPPDPPTDPPIPPVDPPPPPPPTEWVSISDYQTDFQSVVPASGWNYVWNPTGKLGNSTAFNNLLWSSVAQAYNTTGGATMAPAGSKTHNDDYLHLSATGGHPGKPGYLPMAGYTIQADDGSGAYRIAESAISKLDGITSQNEDGLEVLVYVNNLLLGSAGVSTNGTLTSFNRELGQLNVGDTVWVMVNPLSTQYYDSFINFDFSLEKSVPMTQMGLAASAAPEPGSAALVLTALLGCAWRRPRRRTAPARNSSMAAGQLS